jgi:hypothetical protein
MTDEPGTGRLRDTARVTPVRGQGRGESGKRETPGHSQPHSEDS